MKPLFSFILCCLALFSCKTGKQASQVIATPTMDSLRKSAFHAAEISNNRYGLAEDTTLLYKWNRGMRPRTFNDSTPVFSRPDTNSTIIGYYTFNEELEPIGIAEMGTNDIWMGPKEWYKVMYGNLPGYIMDLHLVTGYDLIFAVYAQPTGKEYLAGRRLLRGSNIPEYALTIRKFKSHDTMLLSEYTIGYEQSIMSIKQIGSTLKSGGPLFLYESAMGACPGTTYHVFIAENLDGKFQEIVKTYSEGETSYYYHEAIYIPLKMGNGKIMLVENGDLEHIFDYNTASLNTYPYPSKKGIPIEDLIVIVSEDVEYKTEENSYVPLMDKKGNYLYQRNIKSTYYYRWDGRTLTESK